MTGMNNALLQLALMLQGNPRLHNGFGNNWNAPSDVDPSGSPTPPMHEMMNSWATMPNPRDGVPNNHLSITPAQEFFLGTNPADVIPFGRAMAPPRPWTIPVPETYPSPYPTDIFPPIINPFPPRAIPYDDTDDGDVGDGITPYGEKPKKKRKMSRKCEEEWEWARRECEEQRRKQYESGDIDTIFDMEKCKRGYVSIECGGEPLDWGPKGKPYKPNSFITA